MSDVTAKNVWTAINEDPEFLEQPEAMREATQPFVEALPVILADLLDEPATLSNIMKAKLIFLRHCLANEFIAKAVAAMPDESLSFIEREDMIPLMDSALRKAVNLIELMTSDMPAFLKANEITEPEVMMGSNLGLRHDALGFYESGKLTIGKLLATQPMVIVKNT